jgi:Arc/MetJ family transcription regulator
MHEDLRSMHIPLRGVQRDRESTPAEFSSFGSPSKGVAILAKGVAILGLSVARELRGLHKEMESMHTPRVGEAAEATVLHMPSDLLHNPLVHTNIDIDDSLILRAMKLTGLRTKKAVVEEGLRALIRLLDQREVRDLRGRLHWEDGRAQPKGARESGADPG